MVRSLSKRGMPKPFAILIVALLALYFVPLNALPASAVTVGGFEIEGNLADDATPGIDWATVDTTSASFSTAVDHTTGGQDDTVFGGGSKEYNDGGQNGWPGWDFGGGNAPGKSDFGRWATYTNSDANNHLWLFLGFDRDAAQGTAKYAFELNQVMQADPNNANPTRSQGDLKFIIWDQGNGALTLTGDAMNTDVGLYRWIDPDQQAAGVAVDTDKDGHWVKVGANGTFVGAINTAAVTVPSWWTSGNVTQGSIGADQFGEFGVDLTSFGAVLGCPSQGFTAANARSITGTGTTGALVDYLSALGVHIPSTCTSLVTHATNQVVVGNSISDTATITPSNATGTVTFKVYGPDDATCANAPVATLGPINVAADGTASSGNYTPATVGTYRWIASFDSNDDAHFADSVGKCNDTNEQSVVVKASPKITTTAGSSGTLPGAVTVSDVAHLTGLTETAGGKVTFTVYGPFGLNSSPTCTGTSQSVDVSLGSVGADHAIDVSSGPLTVTHAGKYYWIASYNGDTNNEAVAGQCGDANETSTVEKTTPTITTDADATASLPDDATVSDTATLSGVTANAGGSIVFKLFGPDSGTPTCTEGVGGNLEFTSEAFPVNGSGTYGPATHPVTKAGTYYWVAYYSGDGDNNAVAGVCGETKETSNVDKASPKITTTASTTGNFPGVVTIADTAHLTGLTADATGKVTFNVYGPFASDSQPTCSGNPFKTIEVTLGSVGADHAIDVPSGAVTVTQTGKYYWVATYNGDTNNEAVAGACGDTNETSDITKASPAITTTAGSTGTLPGAVSISDTAHLTGLTETAGGSVTFTVYGPFPASSDPTCTGTPTTVVVALGSVGADHAIDVESGPVSVTAAGKYYWVASYGGDGNNNPVAGQCGDSNETSTVDKASPAISTVAEATDAVLPNTSVTDTAHLSGLTSSATGSVTFTIYSDDSCETVVTTLDPVAIGTVTNGTATVVSGDYTGITSAGDYFFIASYSGDDNNKPVAGECGDENESVHIFNGPHPTLTKIANPPTTSVVQPGDHIVYTVTVGNTGDVAIDDGKVTDTLPPYITVDQASVSASFGTFTAGSDITTSAGTIVWTVDLAPGESKSLTYTVQVNFDAPQLKNLVNLAEFFTLQATTVHTVPSGALAIVKSVTPVAGNGVVVKFGDTLTYTLTVSATGTLNQPNVVVNDYIPGYDPARPTSGKTTYVAGSAKCIGAGTCTVSGPDAKHQLTWSLGTMPGGTSRQVTFQVTIDDVTGAAGETVAVDILNAGAVKSDRTPTTPSNQVVTPVSKVLPVKVSKPPVVVLPHTGASLPIGPTVGGALGLLGLGLLLVAAGRRRSWMPRG